MVDVFENAASILIHDKDVQSIKTTDGTVIWEKESSDKLEFVARGNTVSFGQNIVSTGDVLVDWGDNTTETINNPTMNISHTYIDGELEHTITLEGTITTLGAGCFYNSGLVNVSIPNTVTTLGDGCFSYCSGLINISIPTSVTSIGGGCFGGCTGLTSVFIPNTVSNIGTTCFGGCQNLISYMLYWTDNIVQYDSVKMKTNTETVFTIPNGTLQAYISANYPSDKLVERSA